MALLTLLSSLPLLPSFFLALLPLTGAFQNCPFVGPDFPIPTQFSTSVSLQLALTNLTSRLNQVVSTGNSSYGVLDANANSFSIEVFSAQDPSALLQFHHTATDLTTLNSTGVSSVNSSTVYRIGSNTKLLSVYTFLIQVGDVYWNQPVTKYVPELAALAENMSKNTIDNVQWADVTLGELASHMADIGRDNSELGEMELAPGFNAASYGLPPVNVTEVPTCSVDPLCDRTAFFAGFSKRHPVFATSTTPIYSNVAFQILSYALENITGQDFPTLMEQSIFTPLNLTHTSYSVPRSDSVGIIPGDDLSTLWAVDIGDESPAGGAYSSASDLSSIGRSILTSSLISPAQTRRWMKPITFTADPLQFVGHPWEIQRIILQDPYGIVHAYTKAGDLGSYASYLVLLPNYDLGFTILVAGSESTSIATLLGSLIGDIIIPAAETAARQQATDNYAGNYGSNKLNSSLTIETDESSLGLGITEWISNGTDILPVIVEFVLSSSPSTVKPVIRLYPTNLKEKSPDGSSVQAFRAVFQDAEVPAVAGSFEQNCISWEEADGFYFDTVSLDEFLITTGADGCVKSITPRAFRIVLDKLD